ncbi:MAG: TetR/AcrR family transcriptional regulator [Propionibacteriales bacterium]|nr:TetR/AcrR family transcriptional regulator [Propionibacteriales bacterium]
MTASASSRLSIDDWTERALALLMDEGVGAIKINRLCRELGVTKGSFYWHFADLDAFLAAIAEKWCAETREALSGLSELHALPPLERIRAMALRLIDDRSWSVERALREWAKDDAKVAVVIVEADQFVFELVQAALLELGHSAQDARLRAGLLVYAGIGFAHGQASLPQPTADDIENLITFLSSEAQP